ncbi:alginate export family protein [Tautonia sp. JC769]|uniref:alginate export family protein n=1 Tax=Tautonia sp. JC769 TaxID=3232135 RepID=UPI00345A0642
MLRRRVSPRSTVAALGMALLAYRLGFHQGMPRNAGAVSAGFGRRIARLPFRPMFMASFDHASGNRRPGAGDIETFNQLFPLGHTSLGVMDILLECFWSVGPDVPIMGVCPAPAAPMRGPAGASHRTRRDEGRA